MPPFLEATLGRIQTLPDFGSFTLYGVLVAAAYTFAVSLVAGRGRPRLLQAARLGAYGTVALVLVAILLLAYAFLTHDFRIRYVARYSDRSMATPYLFTALWGGQDGSLLWWLFLQALFAGAAVRWLRGRYRELQPYVIATLMLVLAFFAALMLFAANPFQIFLSGAKPDGTGLNPLLQNYWMILHPPALYLGFVGTTVPFGFAIAALVSGRLDNEWVVATRKWMLFAWLFLSIGNALGMVWAYEELGWGGYWAWDPVENAGLLPWLSASAYVHSTMIQERRNMLKTWNVVLICLTFLLTVFGTFLTRSGLIASVHSFAQSNIGAFFLWFIGFALLGCMGLIAWRWPILRRGTHVDSLASREATFVINNWALVGFLTFLAIATTLPLTSAMASTETVTVGPPFFNRFAKPFGLFLFLLMGLAPLFGWGRTSTASLRKSLPVPLAAFVGGGLLHLLLGNTLGFPPLVEDDAPYAGLIGTVLQKLDSVVPLLAVSLVAFNVAVILQEFIRGVGARRRAAERRNEPEGVAVALFRLVSKNRRRYGGYLVHLGIVSMFLGFTGQSWVSYAETSLAPGEQHEIGGYRLKYLGRRTCPGDPACSAEEQADRTKTMLFADFEVGRNGDVMGRVSPAKFVYRRMPDRPTSEVGMLRTLRDDLYLVVGTLSSGEERSTFRFYVNPLVSWIWIGLLALITGATISLWPEISQRRLGAWGAVRRSQPARPAPSPPRDDGGKNEATAEEPAGKKSPRDDKDDDRPDGEDDASGDGEEQTP